MIRTLAVVSLFAAVACGGSGNSVSFSARSGGAIATSRPRSGDLTLSSGLVLSRVRVVINDIKLEAATGNPNDDSDDQEVHLAPVLVDLNAAALDGGKVQTVTNANVKAGTYKEIKLKIHKPNGTESSDPAIQQMASQNASIIVDGTIDTVAFSFVSSIEAKEEFEGSIVLKDGSNLTLNIDPSSWFGASAAARIDPRVADNRSQIESNMKTSFKAFKDDKRDGKGD